MPIPNLYHQGDGTPSILRKPTVYQDLYFYRKSDVLVQLTKVFCERFLPPYGDRTVDQMVQAARSVKQNIVEGFTDGQTSVEVEVKLLGIAKGSNQELLEDYMDYLKAHNLSDWHTETQMPQGGSGNLRVSRAAGISSFSRESSQPNRYDALLSFCRTHNDDADYRPFYHQWTDEEMANTAICLCHMIDKAMESFIKKVDREFVEEGGIRERMTAARLEMRGSQKQIIEQQAQEIASLKAQISSLQRELAVLRGRQR